MLIGWRRVGRRRRDCHGLSDEALQTAYRAIVAAKLTYATSAWWGFTTSDDRRWTRDAGLYRQGSPTVENLVEDADDEFFRRVMYNDNHVLHPLLPDRNEHGYELRHRRHELTLTSHDDKRNFVYRQLHKDTY